jgi:peroxiredoxin
MFCRRHLARLRDDFGEFERRGIAIVALAPHNLEDTREVADELGLPFPLLADATRSVFTTYDVQSNIWSLGQRPAVFLIDPAGMVRWGYHGSQQWDIPDNAVVLRALDELMKEDQKTLERRK